MTKHYTELTGSGGERVQFSAPMFEAKTCFSQRPPAAKLGLKTAPILRIGSLGFVIETDTPAEDFANIDRVEFIQSGKTLLDAAILTPMQSADGEIECRFSDRALDLSALVGANAAATVRTAPTACARPSVPAEYKIFCADVLDTIATHRRFLEEEILPLQPVLTSDDRIALDRRMEEAFGAEWMALMMRGDALVLPYKYDKVDKPHFKRFTENIITRELCKAENWGRSYYKPMGYPGDFQIMNSIYEPNPGSDDPYIRYLFMLGRIAGTPILKRMEYLSHSIEALPKTNTDRSHFHVMSIGAGPACELQRFFARRQSRGEGYSITLVDPEIQALNFAIERVYRSVSADLASIMVSGMNTSFTEMLRPTSTFRHLPPQDLIYSAGLVDYLNPRIARSLISKLYEHLRPGGSVIIGNMNDAGLGSYWPLEYALDWSLYFRNEEEMRDMASNTNGIVELDTDETGAIYMLKVTKPA